MSLYCHISWVGKEQIYIEKDWSIVDELQEKVVGLLLSRKLIRNAVITIVLSRTVCKHYTSTVLGLCKKLNGQLPALTSAYNELLRLSKTPIGAF